MIKESIKFENSTVFEGITSIRALVEAKRNGVNDRIINEVIYDAERESGGKITRELSFLKHAAKEFGFSLTASDRESIEKITLGTSHGGIIAKCGERRIPYIEENKSNILPYGFYVMIEGIEDPYNFGYALRSLYALGASGIVLPERNWLAAAGVVARSSAGASEMITSYVSNDTEKTVGIFKQLGYKVVAADEKTDIILQEADLSMPIFLIVGGEKRGISKKILSLVDTRVKIDYGRSFNASLSAASAVTVFGYEIHRQNQKQK